MAIHNKKNKQAKKREALSTRLRRNQGKIIKISIAILFVLAIGYVTGHTRYVGAVLVCGKLPVITTDFAAAESYTVPGRHAYYVTPDSNFYCTAEEAEEAGYTDKGF